MAWPTRASMWGSQLAAAEQEYAATARAIAGHVPVTMVARPSHGDAATAACGTDRPIEVVEWPIDDSWARDIGAIVITQASGAHRAGVQFAFNAWGEKFAPYGEDARFATRMCEHLGLATYDARPFVLEGGAITVDGEGMLVTTEEVLLNPNRNPSMSRADVEAALRTWLGADRIVWLPFGLVEDDDTDGHVDNVAAFVAPGVVVAQTTADRANPNYERLRRNADALVGAGLEVREVDVLPYAVVGGERVVVPPTNFYQCNEGVVVPVVAGALAEAALDAMRGALPDRVVVGVPGEVLAFGGGGVHCITQQVPAP